MTAKCSLVHVMFTGAVSTGTWRQGQKSRRHMRVHVGSIEGQILGYCRSTNDEAYMATYVSHGRSRG